MYIVKYLLMFQWNLLPQYWGKKIRVHTRWSYHDPAEFCLPTNLHGVISHQTFVFNSFLYGLLFCCL